MLHRSTLQSHPSLPMRRLSVYTRPTLARGGARLPTGRLAWVPNQWASPRDNFPARLPCENASPGIYYFYSCSPRLPPLLLRPRFLRNVISRLISTLQVFGGAGCGLIVTNLEVLSRFLHLLCSCSRNCASVLCLKSALPSSNEYLDHHQAAWGLF